MEVSGSILAHTYHHCSVLGQVTERRGVFSTYTIPVHSERLMIHEHRFIETLPYPVHEALVNCITNASEVPLQSACKR